jgi:hypothetical protein
MMAERMAGGEVAGYRTFHRVLQQLICMHCWQLIRLYAITSGNEY